MGLRVACFDSGIGGLSVLHHARREIAADFLYLADSGRAPWGDADPDWVRERSLGIARYLAGAGVDALVIACNTATALAAEAIRAELEIPVVAMEPAIKPAAAFTRNGRITVLATRTTLRSPRYRELVRRHASHLEIHAHAPHHWISAIEQGMERDPDFQDRLRAEVRELAARGSDAWVLACTHFPFLAPQLERLLGPSVRVIDPAPAVTARLQQLLGTPGAMRPAAPGRLEVLTSGAPETLRRRLVALDIVAESVQPLPF